MSFDEWMKKVNLMIGDRLGLSADDLPDVCYRDWFENGIGWKKAAVMAISGADY